MRIPTPTRRLVAAAIAVATLVGAVTLWWLSTDPFAARHPNAPKVYAAPATIERTETRAMVGKVTDEAVAAWRSAGLTEADCEQLSACVPELLASLADADFDRALRLHESRGATLSQRAPAIAEGVFRSGIIDSTPEHWQTLSDVERVRLAWTAQWGGASAWSAWDPSAVEAGLGVQTRDLSEGYSVRASGTMFAFPDDSHLAQRARDGLTPVAWLAFPLQLGDSPPALFMVVLVKDESGTWRPMLVSATGPGPNPRMLF